MSLQAKVASDVSQAALLSGGAIGDEPAPAALSVDEAVESLIQSDLDVNTDDNVNDSDDNQDDNSDDDQDDDENAIHDDDDQVDDEGESEDDDSDDEDESDLADEKSTPDEDYLLVGDEKITLNGIEKRLMRHKDYTEKTQTLAKERDSLAKDKVVLDESRGKYVEGLQILKKLFEGQAQDPGDEYWKDLKEDDPERYIAERDHVDQMKTRTQGIENEIKAEREEASKEAVTAFKKRTAQANERLIDAYPTWKDPEVAKREKTAILEGVIEHYGFKPEEFRMLADDRMMKLMKDAVSTRSKAKNKAKKKVTKVIRSSKGSVKRPTRDSKVASDASKRHSELGTLDSAVDFLLTRDSNR